jgi:hypothetical protein
MSHFEGYELEDANGNILPFNQSEIVLRNRTGYGQAPIDYEVEKTFQQDGASVQRFRLKERTLTLQIFVNQDRFSNRDDYWNFRNDLLAIVNPLAAPLKFTVIRTDGSTRQLTNLYPNDGFSFSTGDTNWNIDETVTLTAFTPYWIEPTATVLTPSITTNDNLVFPATFPISFGNSGNVYSTGTLSDVGTWRTFPTITINGGYTTATLINGWNNKVVQLFVAITSSEQRTIDFNPETLSIVDGNGVSRFDELTATSDLLNFYLNGGSASNSISVNLTGTSGTPSVSISYNKSYIGI